MDKRKLSETDIISKFILPAVKTAGWVDITQILQLVQMKEKHGYSSLKKLIQASEIFDVRDHEHLHFRHSWSPSQFTLHTFLRSPCIAQHCG